jgi:hypothetical protein
VWQLQSAQSNGPCNFCAVDGPKTTSFLATSDIDLASNLSRGAAGRLMFPYQVTEVC